MSNIRNQDNLILNEGYQKKFFLSGAKFDKLISGNKKFLDLSSSGGCLILGHQGEINEKIFKLVKKNKVSFFSAPNIYSLKFSLLLKKIFKNYNFIFCNSGAEANLKALRICRTLKKGKFILKVSGGWHGSVDDFLIKKEKSNKKFISDGIDKYHLNKIKFLEFNNFKQTEKIIKKYKKNSFCIIAEPIQAGFPLNVKKYNLFLREMSKKHKIPLIFDEIITGLRDDGTSYSINNKIFPEVITLGKAFAGGFPIGIIAVKKSLKKYTKNIFFGGTYSANSLSMIAAYYYTSNIIGNKKKIFQRINNLSENFVNRVNDFITLIRIDAQILNYKSILRIIFSKKKIKDRSERDFFEIDQSKKIEKFKIFLRKKKIYYTTNGIFFIPFQISKKNFEYVIKNICAGLLKNFR